MQDYVTEDPTEEREDTGSPSKRRLDEKKEEILFDAALKKIDRDIEKIRRLMEEFGSRTLLRRAAKRLTLSEGEFAQLCRELLHSADNEDRMRAIGKRFEDVRELVDEVNDRVELHLEGRRDEEATEFGSEVGSLRSVYDDRADKQQLRQLEMREKEIVKSAESEEKGTGVKEDGEFATPTGAGKPAPGDIEEVNPRTQHEEVNPRTQHEEVNPRIQIDEVNLRPQLGEAKPEDAVQAEEALPRKGIPASLQMSTARSRVVDWLHTRPPVRGPLGHEDTVNIKMEIAEMKADLEKARSEDHRKLEELHKYYLEKYREERAERSKLEECFQLKQRERSVDSGSEVSKDGKKELYPHHFGQPDRTPLKTLLEARKQDHEEVRVDPEEERKQLQQFFQGISKPKLREFAEEDDNYEDWRHQFDLFVHRAQIPVRHKMVMLKSSLKGKPKQLVANLGYTEKQYQMALNKLDSRYGGARRMLFKDMEKLQNISHVRMNDIQSIENFSDQLSDILVRMVDNGRESELVGNSVLYNMVIQKVPEALIMKYYGSNPEEDGMTSFADWLSSYVNQRLEVAQLKSMGLNSSPPENRRYNGASAGKKPGKKQNAATNQLAVVAKNTTKGSVCLRCGKEHLLSTCPEWKKLSVSERWALAKERKMCYRCLDNTHLAKNCPNSEECKIDGCDRTHHRDLHNPGKSATSNNTATAKQTYVTTNQQDSQPIDYMEDAVSLRLVPVYLCGKDGRKIVVNALLDEGSDTSYVKEDVIHALGIQGSGGLLDIATISGTVETPSLKVQVEVESLDGRFQRTMDVWTMPDMCSNLKVVNWNELKVQFSHLSGIDFPKSSGRQSVDLLLGSDYPELGICLDEKIGGMGEPIARKTPLGWTCVGRMTSTGRTVKQCNTLSTTRKKSTQLLDEDLRRLWNQDLVVPERSQWSTDDELAMKKAIESRVYVVDRYQVAIPWKKERPELPDNRAVAERRLRSLEAMLRKKPIEVAEQYRRAFEALIEKGYIVHLPEVKERGWYLPHFAVIREDKETTKVRIVYDGAATYNGVSLNDEMLTGPNLQRDILEILLRFRSKPVALVGDIKEMFNQVVIDPVDRRFHRLLWRGLDSSRPMETYEAVRLVFGDRASPFLAMFVLRRHAEEVATQFPIASDIIVNSVYMDDVLDSLETLEMAKQVRQELQKVAGPAGFHIRRWCSSHPEVLEGIPEDERVAGVQIAENTLPSMKALGVMWHASDDVFSYEFKVEKEITSKRLLLQQIARIFDPFQFLAPLVIIGKTILQKAWLAGCDWDDPLPDELQKLVERWLVYLGNLHRIQLPRCYRNRSIEEVKEVEIHTFTDASKEAYGAVSYIRFVYQDDRVQVSFVAAKARVAPLKAVSIPRLELMAAVLGVRLARIVARVLKLPITSHCFWTDSTDVIYWIRGQSKNFKPFVANRVSEIQDDTLPGQWLHVPGKFNPADHLTRGLGAEAIMRDSNWSHGPEFLTQEAVDWPVQKIPGLKLSEDAACESPKARVTATASAAEVSVGSPVEISRYSSWRRVVRVVAWMYRFCRRRKSTIVQPTLTPGELDLAERTVIRAVQREVFSRTFGEIARGKISPSNPLRNLHPIIGSDQVLRVGGRLQSADLPFEAIHPAILPKNHHATTLVIRHYHEEGKHVRGVEGVLSDLRQRFWIVNGREEVKKYEFGCISCRKAKKKCCQQIMAPLPAGRVKVPIRAFASSGVDYGGPFLVKVTRRTKAKRYLCLFTCLASRAIHLEVAFSLDTPGFLNALSRMTARRGKPLEMVSDNGSNFVGAEREIGELVALLDGNEIGDWTSNRGIEWKFHPPYGSHHGGVFESLIKSTKRALNAVLRDASLTDEELLTAVVEVEGMLNSRPLWYVSGDPKDDNVLTPNHFLHGQAGGQLAPHVVDEIAFSPRHRWRYVQDLIRQVWNRWQREYLHRLQTRQKWRVETRDLATDDVVLVTDVSNPRGRWPLGKILEVFPGLDGHVRTVKVRVHGKEMIRPITKICHLFSEDLVTNPQ